MEPTTLVTFLLGSVHGAGCIDLIGSWDNFSGRLPMQKDRQKGNGHWWGTHTFPHIICDGDPSEQMQPRTGALKMGGTYWYYYQREGQTDFHNPDEPNTNLCPLLPGQTVNVLEVPTDAAFSRHMSGEPLGEAVLALTMNPDDRYRTPAPRPRHQHQKSKSVYSTRRPSTSQAKARHDWFSKELGRLQTAVTDMCLSSFAQNPSLGFGCSRRTDILKGLRSVPGTRAESDVCGDRIVRKSSLVKRKASKAARRPQARHRNEDELSGDDDDDEEEDDDSRQNGEDSNERFGNPFLVQPRKLRSVQAQHSVKRPTRYQKRPELESIDDDYDEGDVDTSSGRRESTRPQSLPMDLRDQHAVTDPGHPRDEDLASPSETEDDWSSTYQTPQLSRLSSLRKFQAADTPPAPTRVAPPPPPNRAPPPLPGQGPGKLTVDCSSLNQTVHSDDSECAVGSVRGSVCAPMPGSWTPQSMTSPLEKTSPIFKSATFVPTQSTRPHDVLDSPASMQSEGFFTPQMISSSTKESFDHDEVLRRLTEHRRRSLGLGDFFESTETIKPGKDAVERPTQDGLNQLRIDAGPDFSQILASPLSQAEAGHDEDRPRDNEHQLGPPTGAGHHHHHHQQASIGDLNYLGAVISY